MTKQKNLIEYIKLIYEMESSLFMMKNLRSQMINKSNNLRFYKGKNLYAYESKPPFFSENDSYQIYGNSLIFGFIGCFVFMGWHFTQPGIAGFFGELIVHFLCGTIIGAGIISIPFLISYLIRINEWKNSKANTDSINSQIIQGNQNIIMHYQKQATIIDSETKELNIHYNNVLNTLNAYYNLDIIYPKYRNFVAISSIYEYLLSQRCTTLEGHGGAYDTFEYESRLDHILLQLDEIIDKLDQIQNSQYQLYKAIENGFSESNALFDNVVDGINRLEVSQELSNYYNRIAAQNSEYFKLIHFFTGKL